MTFQNPTGEILYRGWGLSWTRTPLQKKLPEAQESLVPGNAYNNGFQSGIQNEAAGGAASGAAKLTALGVAGG